MQEYADNNSDLTNGFIDYFRIGNSNRICLHIVSGRISPWVIFNSSSGVEFLEGLREDQVQLIVPYIEPDYWQRKFHDYPEDEKIVDEELLNPRHQKAKRFRPAVKNILGKYRH